MKYVSRWLESHRWIQIVPLCALPCMMMELMDINTRLKCMTDGLMTQSEEEEVVNTANNYSGTYL